jgi:hypothetical protein
MAKSPVALDSFDVKLSLGVLTVGGKWIPSAKEAEAAWELYVELVTRVAVVELEPGLLRVALTSLYGLFGTTRAILREKGPEVARPRRGADYSFGYLAVTVLNYSIRPLLTKWHPVLSDWEAHKPSEKSAHEHEADWPRNTELRSDLARVKSELHEYAHLLARVAGVPDLLRE